MESLCRKYLTVGDCFGEVAFFTEIPQMQTVRTVTVCRVLVVPRSAYQSIKSAFPLGTRQVLDNLQAHAELVRIPLSTPLDLHYINLFSIITFLLVLFVLIIQSFFFPNKEAFSN